MKRFSTILKLSFFLCFLLAGIATASAQTLYWVNGSGSWNESSHWSLSSGGAGGAGVPTLANDVVFDKKSFTQPGAIVTIDAAAYCNNLTWKGTEKVEPTLHGQNNTSLAIGGSLLLQDKINNRFDGSIVFTANGQQKIVAKTPIKSNLLFAGTANYTVDEQAISTDKVQILDGSVTASGKLLNGSKPSSIQKAPAGPKRIVDPIDPNTDIIKVQPQCNNGNDGSITINITGGVPNYTYTLIRTLPSLLGYPSVVTSSLSVTFNTNITAGSYIIQVRDNTGNSRTAPIDIGEPDLLMLTVSPFNITCSGANDGKITATATGGNTNYTYTLKKGGVVVGVPQTVNGPFTFTGLVAGNDYTIEMNDAKNCGPLTDGPFTIIDPVVLGGSVTAHTDILCFGTNTGSITATATNGTAPYEYSIDGGAYQASGTFNGLAAGNHTVTIRDVNLCSFTLPAYPLTQPATALTATNTFTAVKCKGGNDGTITSTATGGTGLFTYKINGAVLPDIGPQAGPATFSGLLAGDYTITITDGNGCIFTTATTKVTEPASGLGATTAAVAVLCKGGNNGSITVTATGGTANFTYTISPAVKPAIGPIPGAATFSGLLAGDYTVTITDANGCVYTTPTISVTEPAAALTATNTITGVKCKGGSDGTLTATAAGGTAPYTYKINGVVKPDIGPIPGAATFVGLAVGNYTVTVTDAKGCTFTTASTAVTEPLTALSGSSTLTPVKCKGGNDGTITVTATGGTANYTYTISPAVKPAIGPIPGAATFSGLIVGSYTITITDANGCTFTTPAILITEPLTALSSSNTVTNVKCKGGSDGTLTSTATGGTAPYTYKINNIVKPDIGPQAGAATFIGLPVGSYTVTVTDANGCTFTTPATPITEPAAGVTATNTTTAVKCKGGSDGTLTSTAIGGTAPYTYKINGIVKPDIGPQAGPATFSGLPAGSYTVTITDAAGCTFTTPATPVTEPAAGVSATNTSTAVKCKGGSDGTITATAVGGTANYTYTITPAIKPAIGPIGGPATFTNLPIGSYTITVTDAAGCTFTTPATVITEPIASLGATTTSANVKCNGVSDGSITATATGGTANYSYAISPAVKPAIGPIAGSALFSNIPAGSYTVTITDANGCTFTTPTIVITQPVLALSSTNTSTNVKCNGGNDGTLTSTATGGTTPYTYKINGAVMPDIGPQAGAALFTGLIAGDYTITITDANGCTFTTATTTITQPIAPLTATVTPVKNVSCNGGSDGIATVTPGGGTKPYTYTIDIAGNIPTIDPVTGAATFSGINAASHTVTITDANGAGCSITAIIDLTEPAAITFTEKVTNVTGCYGNANGEIEITAIAGGTGPYNYVLTPGSISNTTGKFTGLKALDAGGTPIIYKVTVTDSKGCTKASSDITLTQPYELSFTYTKVDANCSPNTGEIHFTDMKGGLLPFLEGNYQYSINGGATWQNTPHFIGLIPNTYVLKMRLLSNPSCQTANTIVKISKLQSIKTDGGTWSDVSPCAGNKNGTITINVISGVQPFSFSLDKIDFSNTTGKFVGLEPKSYKVYIKDGNGCIDSVGPITIKEPTPINIVFQDVTNVTTCWNSPEGMITIIAGGGTGDLLYSRDGTTFQNNGFFTNLTKGNYTITIKDEEGCIKTVSVFVDGPPEIVIDPTSTTTNVTCNGYTDGAVNIIATGGTGALTYSLNGGAPQATGLFTGLTAGTYTITITDANSCKLDHVVTITEPAPITFTSQAFTDITCSGANDGTITIVAAGGFPPFQYSIDGGLTFPNATGIFTGLGAGNYTVNVKDANGCVVVGNTYTITDPTPVTITSETSTNSGCFGSNSGTITVITSGGVNPLTFTLKNGATTVLSQPNGIFTNVGPGTYTVEITDANSCVLVVAGPFTITEAPELKATSVATDVKCNGDADGTITVTASGGTPPYTYSFDGGPFGASNTASGLSGGNHNITVRDAANCEISIVQNIVEAPVLTISLTGTDPSCHGMAIWNGKIVATSTGGTFSALTPKLYRLDGGVWTTTPTFNNVAPGAHTVTVMDANNCTAVANITLIEPTAVSVLNVSTVDPTCTTLGSITITGQGGSGTYTYTLNPGGATNATGVFSGLGGGTYNVDINDSKGCGPVNSGAIVINSPTTLTITNVVVTHVTTCYGNDEGALDIQVAGATGTVLYSIDGGLSWGNTSTFTNLPAGNYSIQVNDDNNCITGTLVQINEPAQIVLTVDQTIEPTPSLSDGEIHVSATGGTGLLTFVLNPGAVTNTTGIFTGLPAGIYSVTVTDANGCSQTITDIGLSDFTATITATDVTCNGLNDGTITITVTGTINFTVNWTKDGVPYDTEMNAKYDGMGYKNLEPGVYVATVTDNVSLKVIVLPSVTINEPAAITITNVVVGAPDICAGKNQGSITIEMDPAGGPYEYSIDNGATFVPTNVFSNLPSGSHDVVVRVGTCTATWTSNPIVLDFGAIPDPIVVTQDPTSGAPVVCPDDETSTLVLTVSGGVPDYSYLWDDGSVELNRTELGKGDHTLTVTDQNNCQLVSTFNIAGPADWNLTAVYDSVTCRYIPYATITSPMKRGKITVTATGATPGYVYDWQRISNDEANLPPFQFVGNVATDLYPVTETFDPIRYVVVVTDTKGCTYSESYTVPYKVHIKTQIVSKRMADLVPVQYWDRDTACYNGRLMLSLDTLSVHRNFDSVFGWQARPNVFGSVTETNDTVNPIFRDTTYIKAIVSKTVAGETCYDWDTIKIHLYPRLGVKIVKDEKFENDNSILLPQGITFNLTSMITSDNTHPLKFSWDDPALFNPAEGNQTNITIPLGYALTFDEVNRRYYTNIHAIAEDLVTGCIDADTVRVHVLKNIEIPNAFSPNGDGKNDTWAIWDQKGVPINFLFPRIEVEVFNRWGSRVFYSKGYNKPWDGKSMSGGDLPVGTYYFVIKYNREGYSGEAGSVTILR